MSVQLKKHKYKDIEGYKESELKKVLLPEAWKDFQEWARGMTVMLLPKEVKGYQDVLVYYYDFDKWYSQYKKFGGKKVFKHEV